MSVYTKKFTIILSIIFMLIMIATPEIAQKGVKSGLIVSANIIIPSLFPFMISVFMLMNSSVGIKSHFINRILYKIFGMNADMFLVFVLSLIGGYPAGAGMLNELKKQNTIDEKAADIMLTYCVNAGPSFIVSVIGVELFGSKKLGMILLISHLLPSFIMSVLFANKLKKQNPKHKTSSENSKKFSEIFVSSINTASSNVLKICSFIVVFFTINSYIDFYSQNLPIIKCISLFTEVTSAVTKTQNIVFISFLLGMSGFSIWFQIFALSSDRKINIIRFCSARLAHGMFSAIITKLLLKVIDIKLATFSNNEVHNSYMLYTDTSLFVSMMIMLIVLLTFIYSKNNSGKIIEDVI